jgi:hypothetical protein
MSRWRKNHLFTDVLKEKVAGGCVARVLVVDPKSPALPSLVHRHYDSDADHVRAGLERAMTFFTGVAADMGGAVQVRKVSVGLPYSALTIVDDSATSLPYMYAHRPEDCPMWLAARGTALYASISAEYEMLWRMNDPKA